MLKSFFSVITFILVVILLCGCVPASVPPPPRFTPSPVPPTFTFEPTLTPAITPTVTPSPTITPTPAPLSKENVNALVEVAQWSVPGYEQFALSQDGKLLAMFSYNELAIVDTKDGIIIGSLPLPSDLDTLSDLKFSPDGRFLAGIRINSNSYGIPSYETLIWQLDDLSLLQTIKPPQSGPSIGFSSDSKLLATTDIHGYVYIWQISDWELIKVEKNGSMDIFFLPDSPNLFSNFQDVAYLWNPYDGTRILTIYNFDNTRFYNRMAVSPNGKFLAIAAEPNQQLDQQLDAVNTIIHLWDVEKGTSLSHIDTQTINSIDSISFSQDSGLLVFNTAGAVKIVNVIDGELVGSLPSAPYVLFSHDGMQIMTARPGVVKWYRPGSQDSGKTNRNIFDIVDLKPLLKINTIADGQLVKRDGDILSLINDQERFWITAHTPLYVHDHFSIKLNFTGKHIALWGRLGYFGDRETYSEWWQGINVLFIGQDGDRTYLTIYDGNSETGEYIQLPQSIRNGQDFTLHFLDPQGTMLEILDEREELVLHIDISDLNNLTLPEGIFPDQRINAGIFVGPYEELSISELLISFEVP
jgi:hypothetical protein